MKALDKDPSRRYETANELARDIERYLADEPVEACPPSAAYRLRKLARRYRTPLRVAAGFALLLIGATLLSTWQAVRARRAEARARADRDRAVLAEKDAVQAQQTAAKSEASTKVERDKAIAEKNRADKQAAIAQEVNLFLNEMVLGQTDVGQQLEAGAAPNPDLTLREAL